MVFMHLDNWEILSNILVECSICLLKISFRTKIIKRMFLIEQNRILRIFDILKVWKLLESIFRNWVDHYQEIFGTETLLKRIIYLKLFLFPKLCYSRLTFASNRILTQVIPGLN